MINPYQFECIVTRHSDGNLSITDIMGCPLTAPTIQHVIRHCQGLLETETAESLQLKSAKWDKENNPEFKFSGESGSRRDDSRKKAKPGYVYLAWAKSLNLWKIGKSWNPKKRGDQLKKQSPVPIVVAHSFWSLTPLETESRLHSEFQSKRTYGEWFQLSLEDVDSILAMDDDLPF